MRYKRLAEFDLPKKGAPGDPSGKEDVDPVAERDPETGEVWVTPQPYDPGRQVAPVEALVFAIPSGSPLAGPLVDPADLVRASELPRTVTPLPTDPAGGPRTLAPLPEHDGSVDHLGVVVVAYPA